MNCVVNSLKYKDTFNYYNLFPPFDTLWRMVNHSANATPEAQKQLASLKEHPQSLIDFDPFYNKEIIARFCAILAKGEDSGIHWKDIVIQRYELQKASLTRDLAGYDRIAPESFKGYLFVRDILGRHTYCITIREIQKIEGYFFGGQVINILEASSIDQFLQREEAERQYYEWLAKNPIVIDTFKIDSMRKDSIKKAADNDEGEVDKKHGAAEDNGKVRREVVDRKFYKGMFDEEIPVELFIRYMKDPKTGKIVDYDGLYKFGDQKDYVRLDITRNADGKWTMEDDPPVGTLELILKDKAYTGTWSNNENGTGYDVLLRETVIEPRKLESLENILERNLSGSVSEESLPEKTEIEAKKKKEDDRGNDTN